MCVHMCMLTLVTQTTFMFDEIQYENFVYI